MAKRTLAADSLSPSQLRSFWSKVSAPKKNGCRLWTAYCYGGYGLFRLNNVVHAAHRIAWVLANPERPAASRIVHSCGNRLCCEATHLLEEIGLAANARHKRWRDANREYVRDYARTSAKKYRAMDPERARAQGRVKDRKRYRENPHRNAQVRARVKAWAEANPEKVRERMVLQRQARRSKTNAGSITARDWREIKEYFDQRCAYCLQRKHLTMDHVIPLSRGGAHDPSNVVPACSSCNCSKGARGLFTMLNR